MCMRTNIEIDDDLLSKALVYAEVRTKRAVVHEALAEYVTRREQGRQAAEYRKQAAEIRKKLTEKRFRRSSLDTLRADRKRPA